MTTRYSESEGVFYPFDQPYTELPADIIEVSLEEFGLAMARGPHQHLEVHDGHVVVVDDALPTLDQVKSKVTADVDDWAEQARRAALVNTIQLAEYEVTAEQALAFKEAGYIGDPPPAVLSWMEVTNLSAQAATDAILEMRRQYLDALLTLRGVRLHTKADIAAAASVDEVNSIAGAAKETIDAIAEMVANI